MEQMIAELGREDLYILIFLVVAVIAGIVFSVVFFRGLMAPKEELGPLEGGAPSPYSQSPSPEPEPVAASSPTGPPAISPVAPQEARLETALAKTRVSFFGRIKSLVGSKTALSRAEMEELEEILYTSDLGPQTVQKLLSAVESKTQGGGSIEVIRGALKSEMLEIFSNSASFEGHDFLADFAARADKPSVLMIVGVNGAGKTTTIGKLASRFAKSGAKVLVAAGDTFRAAAGDQLKIWTVRAQVEIFSPVGVSDPSAVAFKAVEEAKAKGFDVVIVDTAGRLHTQINLMEELKKMKRVISKLIPAAPHEVLLVLDANSGQNALVQAREFHKALDVTGVVLTKLDGSAKGGVAVGLANELNLPIKLIGVGEGVDDLRQFSSKEFVDSIL